MSDRLERLYVLRDQVTGWLEMNAADRAPLVLRLTTILEQIETLEKTEAPKKGTVLDELAKRRAESKPAARQSRPARRAQ